MILEARYTRHNTGDHDGRQIDPLSKVETPSNHTEEKSYRVRW
jgi:hypothetical protein